jgi:cytidylate kinase
VIKGLHHGPVITISREVGCNAVKLAKLLNEKLNSGSKVKKWNVISKEVLYESARELNLRPDEVRKVLVQTDKYAFDEILKAFSSKYFVSERKIIRTVVDVIHHFAIEGHCIIVGRAGHVITSDIKKALHIRLFAPFEYRVKNIMENNSLSKNDAIEFIQRVEKERIAFRKAIMHDNPYEELFDVSLNRATMTDETLLGIIEYAAHQKGIFDS